MNLRKLLIYVLAVSQLSVLSGCYHSTTIHSGAGTSDPSTRQLEAFDPNAASPKRMASIATLNPVTSWNNRYNAVLPLTGDYTPAMTSASNWLVPSAVQTASTFTAASNHFYPCDTTSNSITCTLPASPADKDLVTVKMVIQGGTNNVSIVCAGSQVFNKTGGGTTLTLSLLNQGTSLQYSSLLVGWYVLNDDLPLSKLLQTVPIGNTAFVDAVNGSDSTGVVGKLDKPFLTIQQAITSIGTPSTPSLIQATPGVFTVVGTTNLIFPPNVSFRGAGKRATQIDISGYTGSLVGSGSCAIIPGTNSTFSDCNLLGLTNLGTNFIFPIGYNFSNGDPASTNVTVINVAINNTSDGIFFQASQPVGNPTTYWKFINVDSVSLYDNVSLEAASHTWACQADFYDCNFLTTWDGTSTTPNRNINITGGSGTTGILLRFYGCVCKAAGNVGNAYGVLSNCNGTVELHSGCQFASSVTGGSGGTAYSIFMGTGSSNGSLSKVKVDPSVVYDPSQVSCPTGKFVGLTGQLLLQETTGQTQDVIDVFNSAATNVFKVDYQGNETAVTVTETGSQAANSFKAAPSGSSGAPTYRSIVTADLPTNGNISGTHFIGTGGTPTWAVGAGAGTGGTASVVGTDSRGQITVNAGTLPTGAGAVILTVTFASAFPATPHPVFSSANASTALLSGATMVFMDGGSTTTMVITAGTTGLGASTTYIWNYIN